MNITLRQLELFVAVAEYGRVGRAAEACHVSQAAVSMSLKELERTTGEMLFDRVSNRLYLNDAGRALLPRARRILDAAAELEQPSGRIVLGASTTIGNYLLPLLVGEYMAIHGDIGISLEIANTAAILEKTARFEVDIAFVEGPVTTAGVVHRPWRTDELVVFSSARSHGTIPLEETEWIVRERGSGTRDVFETAMATAGIPMTVKMELGHTEAIKKAVEVGLGTGCLSREAVRREVELGVLHILPTPQLDLNRLLHLVIPEGKHVTGNLQRFLDYVGAAD